MLKHIGTPSSLNGFHIPHICIENIDLHKHTFNMQTTSVYCCWNCFHCFFYGQDVAGGRLRSAITMLSIVDKLLQNSRAYLFNICTRLSYYAIIESRCWCFDVFQCMCIYSNTLGKQKRDVLCNHPIVSGSSVARRISIVQFIILRHLFVVVVFD